MRYKVGGWKHVGLVRFVNKNYIVVEYYKAVYWLHSLKVNYTRSESMFANRSIIIKTKKTIRLEESLYYAAAQKPTTNAVIIHKIETIILNIVAYSEILRFYRERTLLRKGKEHRDVIIIPNKRRIVGKRFYL